MIDVEKGTEAVLNLLRHKLEESGFTQREVEQKLGWGRSYISQLFGRTKHLTIEHVLLILSTIGVDHGAFFAELYDWPETTLEQQS